MATLRRMKVLLQRWDAWVARRNEREALLALGAGLPTPDQDRKLDDLDTLLHASLARDKADWAVLPGYVRPLVVLRGMLDRAVLRALRRQAEKTRADAQFELAKAALESARGPVGDIARSASAAARAAAEAVEPLPRALREAHHFSAYLWKEARGQLVPRAPALIGLGVGWLIAQTFTDSQLTAQLHAWGFGQGPRHAVRSETLHAMNFWLPLLAAALSSYAGSRLAAALKSRYETTSAAASSSGTASRP